MEMKWTPEQEKVIQLQNRNILVSAAAGSGKTAVLVERILTKLTRKEHPIDIDQLLIVTFTRAAAGEMRERLIEAIEEYLEKDPDNEHLQRQQTLIHNAQITTIDGFCSYVIRNYFHTIDLDPGFRTANEGEIKLLKQDVVKEVLEANYQEKTESFQRFVESFATGKNDEILGELILRMYDFSMSNPWPQEWLEQCLEPYQEEDCSHLKERSWMKKLWVDAYKLMNRIVYLQEFCTELVQSPRGPYMYQEAVSDDVLFRKRLEQMFIDRNFDGCKELLENHKYVALSRKKDEMVDEEKRELAKALRDEAKEAFQELKEHYFYKSEEEILEELELCREPVKELIRLTKQFMEAFAAKKRQKNMVDFTDMEHFALEILVKKEEGSLIYQQAADEFSKRYEEILIDEYQDSNLVQETLLQSVSRMRFGENNLFMVGDVKQSIYRFRLARPELFMEKYDTYSLEDGPCQRIDLHKNFRSRAEVLEAVNQIFEQIMGKSLGEVEYDEDAALYPGAEFPEKPEEDDDDEEEETPCCQILLTETDALSVESSEKSVQEIEARMIGEEIRNLVGSELVWDKKENAYRPIRYQDCVILLRTISGWAENFVNVLMDMGIPAYATSKTGYFAAQEVQTILNYLRILDNPMQEIPFTGVLMSPLAGCSNRELAILKSSYPEESIYECVWTYLEEGTDQELKQKLQGFWNTYEQLRKKVTHTPIHELIEEILLQTGYGMYAAAMPGGVQRRANLQMLVEKAMEYESTSYRGLFNFIRYMEQLQKYQVDFGEVNVRGEYEDTVRIMSIHRSKGLEFPVVFCAGMGKQFNMSDASASLVIHQDLGIGIQAVDPEMRTQRSSLMRQVVQKQIRLENLGEEIRVLYVALTRAKEKLFLTGTVKNMKKYKEILAQVREWKLEKLPYGILEDANSYWDWILPALERRKEEFEITWIDVHTLMEEQVADRMDQEVERQRLLNWNVEQVYDEKTKQELEEKFSYQYPYTYLQDMPVKVSVSELKKQGWEDYEDTAQFFQEVQRDPIIPKFMQEEETILQGAERGTAYHRFLECLDYEKVDSQEAIEKQMVTLTEEGKLSQEMADAIQGKQIFYFVRSAIGQRVKQAFLKGKFYREQQFVMSVPANEKNPEWISEEQILVQGIIDAFWEEEDGFVILDYKTDRIWKEEELVRLYQRQLEYYARALEQAYGKKVKEKYLYSFTMGKAILIPEDSGKEKSE